MVWEFGAARVEVGAEEGFVFESCGEDFGGWEEVRVIGWAEGHDGLWGLLFRRPRVPFRCILTQDND